MRDLLILGAMWLAASFVLCPVVGRALRVLDARVPPMDEEK
jgi:hypothetical protein